MQENPKTESQRDKLNRLFKEYGLLSEDVHKHQHYTIIRRTGIEKIAAALGLRITFEICAAQADYAAVKATVKKPIGAKFISIETFGSACKDTSQNKYYLEMAEKRALSRGVLKSSDLYAVGAYGEDEADDFSRARNPEPAAEPVRPTPPAAPMPPVASAPASTAPVAPAGAVPSSAPAPAEPNDDAFLFMQVATAVDSINEAETLDDLATVWAGLDRQVKEELDVYDAKENRKAHLQANQTLR